MSSRAKFLVLIMVSFSGVALGFGLFMRTDYAIKERAYFNNYPYQEMAARAHHPAKIISSRVEIDHVVKIKPVVLASPGALAKINWPSSAAVRTTTIHNPVQKKVRTVKPSVRRKVRTVKPSVRKKVRTDKPSVRKKVRKISDQKKIAVKISHDGWRAVADLGYLAYRNGDYPSAIRYFEQAIKLAPDNPALDKQLAYAYKKTGQFSQAVKYFKRAIDRDNKAPLWLRKEVAQLQRRFGINGYVLYRHESSSFQQLGVDLARSQAGMAVSYQPGNSLFNNKLQIYGRLLAAMKPGQLKIDPDSYQGGVGLRLKPLSGYNLLLSAERLVRVGRFARNDWMVRAGFSQGSGTGYRESKSGWWTYTLYLDAAVINPGNPDIFLTASARGGYNIAVAPGLVLQPRLTGVVSWQKDHFHQASLVEAGPGVNMRYYFNNSRYAAYSSYIDFTAEYRIKISGTSIGGSGPVIGIGIHY